MSIFTEKPYIASLKESFLSLYCSTCFKSCLNKCAECNVMVYCNEECRITDQIFHEVECQMYKNCSKQIEKFNELVLFRMIIRVIIRLNLDGGQPQVDLCSNVPQTICRRTWFDLLGHRDEIFYSKRHYQSWVMTKHQLDLLLGEKFNNFDLLEIFGKLLINRFRVGIHKDLVNGRIAIGWAIYLTTSRFNHSCKPDLLQCSYDINMRLKFSDINRKIPETSSEFNQLTVSYRHQNDFRLTNPLSYVPTRRERRQFLSFFFFNCHCLHCGDDLGNRYNELATNHLCNQCGDSLVLQDYSHDQTISILTCLGRNNCPNTHRILERIQISFINNTEESIDIYEEKLKKIEDLLHSRSVLLLQQREKVFFKYQKLLHECNLNEDQRTIFVNRAIELGELLLQGYDFHLKQSAIYPKILLTDVAELCQFVNKQDKAKQLYQKAIELWQSDYDNCIDYHQLNMKLSN